MKVFPVFGCSTLVLLPIFFFFLVEYFPAVNCGSHLPYVNKTFNTPVFGNVSRNNEDLWKYEYTRWSNITQAVRMEVSSEPARVENPLIFVARLQKGVLSWTIPMLSEKGDKYSYSSRTLCPRLESPMSQTLPQYFYVHVATASITPVSYVLNAYFVENFEMRLGETVELEVNPAGPVYKVFNFVGDINTVRVTATSNTETCAIVSIQNTQCPVYDLARNVEFTGYFQTMTKKAAITIQKRDMNQFYIVLIVKSSDTECETGYRTTNPISPRDNLLTRPKIPPVIIIARKKIVTIRIENVPSVEQHMDAILFPVFAFGLFYTTVFFFIVGAWCRQRSLSGRSFWAILMPKKVKTTTINEEDGNGSTLVTQPNEATSPLLVATRIQYGSFQEDASANTDRPENRELQNHAHNHDNLTESGPSGELLDGDYDMLNDLEHEKDIYRLRTLVTVADLSKKNPKYLKKKYKLYQWNLIVVAVFYTLPVLQLVITYQNVLRSSGDEDICYYNFFCAHPAGVLSAFNNVYSNIGYILLGILFFFIVLRRDRFHKQAVASKDLQEKLCGIPKHYELFYAMAMALVMEGVLSACYHICPNNSNFQFDTSFMYIITCLAMVKVYQTRHPDIVTSAHRVYVLFAGIILIAVIGVLFSSTGFWTVFCIIYIALSLYLSFQLYYMGRVKFDSGLLKRLFIFTRYDCCACPIYKDRMLLLLVANAVNCTFAICGVVYQPKDFATYLLSILIVNGLLYVGFYVAMKIRNKEKILLLPLVVSSLSLVTWIVALIFFFQGLTSWQKSPARSREGNRECRLFGFYDDHDIWHLLSATAIFLSFIALLTLDDDLEGVPRTRIPVF